MIEFDRLTCKFGRTVAVDTASFTCPTGALTYLLGLNGAGKTVAMKTLAGINRPSGGSIRVHGRPLHSYPSIPQVLGCHLDSQAFHPQHAAQRHLLWVCHTGGISPAVVPEVLELVSLADKAQRRIKTLSLGMRQRLGIATALLGNPDVVVLDEPLNGLDIAGIQWTRELLRTLAEQGKTVLVATHNFPEVQLTADHLVVLNSGKVVHSGNLTETFSAAGMAPPPQEHLGGSPLETAFERLLGTTPAAPGHAPATQFGGRHNLD